MAVKKSVKSKKDLDALALKHGATVTDSSGKRFNTAKKKSTVKRMRPAPRPVEEAAVPSKDSTDLVDAIESTGKANVMMMAELKQQIAQIQLQTPEVIMEWDFEFIRDERGYLKRIRATANPSKKTLN